VIVKKNDSVAQAIPAQTTLKREDSQLDLNGLNLIERIFQIKIESIEAESLNANETTTTVVKTNPIFLNCKYYLRNTLVDI
jgi:hypothetical protein